MREALKARIIELIPQLAGQVYDLQSVPDPPPDTYVELSFGEAVWKSAWAGYRQIVCIQLHSLATQASERDAWAQLLLEGLHRQPLDDTDSSSVTLHYAGSRGAESVSDTKERIVRTLRFALYVPEAEVVDVGATEDAWLAALKGWTASQLDDTWRVYGDAWPEAIGSRAILWRMTGSETRIPSASMYEVRKTFTGHVWASNQRLEQATASLLMEAISGALQLPLDADTRRYMSAQEIRADWQTDSFLNGQISLTLAQRRMRPAEEAALIRRLYVHPNLK